MLAALLLIFAVAGYRIATVYQTDWANFAPVMALAFCGAVYVRRPGWWLAPLVALTISDLWINHAYSAEYGYSYSIGHMALRLGCYVAAAAIGWVVAQRKSWLNLFAGALGGSMLFYLVTNTAAWTGDAHYAKSVAGWWQAMTVGHPQFPPTLFFFRNTLLSDLLFTGVFAAGMEIAARRAGQPSLLPQRATA